MRLVDNGEPYFSKVAFENATRHVRAFRAGSLSWKRVALRPGNEGISGESRSMRRS